MALDGYWIDGVCARTQAQAIEFFNSKYPHVDGGYLHTASAAPSGVDGAILNLQTMELFKSGDTWFNHIATITFNKCDTALTVSPAITASEIFYVFTWGFGAVMLSFSWGLAIYWAITAIKKL